MRALVIALLLSWSLLASAQVADLDTLRVRASARGWAAHQMIQYARPLEVWCEALPCTGSRFELTVTAGELRMVRVVLEDAGDGFAMDATWEASGTFGFRFTRGEESIDLAWDLGFEHPELSVHFSSGSASGDETFEHWIAAELTRYLGSARALRDAALASRARLERNTVRILTSTATVREGTFAECFVERGTPEAHGFFDVCTHRMATDEERARVLASLRARLQAERSLIEAHFDAFSAAIRATLAPRSGP
jgi:hypothetical protein